VDSSQGTNPNEMVMKVMWKTLLKFDDDKRVLAYMFGEKQTEHLKVRPLSELQTELQMNDYSPHGLVKVYRGVAQEVELYGLTSFAPLIN